VAAAVRSPSVALALHRGPQIETVSVTGAEQDAALVLPLVYRGERLGEMRVSSHTPGEPYGRVDRALLDELANQTSALVYALRRDTELEATRRRALGTVAEESARLGRDLHDGIAPLLAGAGLTAEALRKGMTPGTPDEQDAEQLDVRLRNAATEIRRLAHDLQPAPVGDRGLTAALADYIATLDAPEMPRIRLRAEVAGSLPADVEQAAYLVALEAVNNVVQHAHAKQCEVSVTLASGELVLRVADDGIGLGQPYVSGIGITSMRSRVQAFGGPSTSPPRRRGEPACRRGFRWNGDASPRGGGGRPHGLPGGSSRPPWPSRGHRHCRRASTQEAVEVTEAVRPDVVLMDLNLPGHGGEVATRTILAAHPEIAVLVLTMHSDDAHLRHALNAGARGYLLKDAEPDAIIRAIVAVREGQAIFDPGIAPRVIATTGASQAQRPFPVLTERERSWTGWPAGCETTQSQPGWASASRQCRTTCRRSCSSWAPPTVPRPLPSPATREWAGAPKPARPAPRASIWASRRISRCGVKAASCRPGIVPAIVR
jgi:signal transduction histidine kinase/CheY-like chemotaxis protein